MLITARRRLPDLGAPAHHVAPLAAFDEATAGELFARIVADGHVDLAGEQDAVGEVVRLCAGLPLAVRVAALLRVEAFHRSTGELLRRLVEQGPTAFAYGAESLARTLGAGLAPLDGRARRLFLGLGLLALPAFAEWTAAAVLDEPGPAAVEALHQLAAVGMVEPVPGAARYRFHDLTRQYARGLAATEPGRAESLADAPLRVGRALLTLTRRAHAGFYGGDFDVAHSDVPDVVVPPAELAEATTDPYAWFERERANIRAAVDQAAALGRAGLCWDLAVSAHEFYAIGGYFDDWRGHPRGRAGGLPGGRGPPRRGHRADHAGHAAAGGQRERRGLRRARARAGGGLLRATGERHVLAVAQRTLANALRRNGEIARPLALFAEALAHYQQSGDVVGSQQALRFIGQAHLDRGDPDSAVAVLREAERMARDNGQARVLAPALYWLGQAYLAGGDLAAAAGRFAEVRRVCPPGSGVGYAYALHGLGDLALARGDPAAAGALLDEAEAVARDGADAGLEARVCLSLAAVAARRGRTGDRVAALRRALVPIRSYGSVKLEIRVAAELADAYAQIGDAEAARAARRRVTELYDRGNVPAPARPCLLLSS